MLKLGTQTNSLTNHLFSQSSADPEVGMGATLLHWTDRTACTVIAWDGKVVTLQEDSATRTDSRGMSDSQDYAYAANPDGVIHYYRKDRKGCWSRVVANETGRLVQADGADLTIGRRDHYHDFSF